MEQIAFEKIKGDFWKGKYAHFDIIILKSCGFINASKLCKSQGRRVDYWFNNASSKKLIEECRYLFFPLDPIKRISKENVSLRGAYVHPWLITHIAIWVSPLFGMIVSDYSQKVLEAKLNHMEQSFQGKILDMEQSIEKCQLDKETLIQEKGEILNQLQKIEKLATVPLKDSGKSHQFMIVNKNDPADPFPYYVIRCQNSLFPVAIQKLRKRFPSLTIVYHLDFFANGVDLYNKLKQSLSNISYYRNNFQTNLSEVELMQEIRVLQKSFHDDF